MADSVITRMTDAQELLALSFGHDFGHSVASASTHLACPGRPSRARYAFNAKLNAALDTPSPRASSLWLR